MVFTVFTQSWESFLLISSISVQGCYSKSFPVNKTLITKFLPHKSFAIYSIVYHSDLQCITQTIAIPINF